MEQEPLIGKKQIDEAVEKVASFGFSSDPVPVGYHADDVFIKECSAKNNKKGLPMLTIVFKCKQFQEFREFMVLKVADATNEYDAGKIGIDKFLKMMSDGFDDTLKEMNGIADITAYLEEKIRLNKPCKMVIQHQKGLYGYKESEDHLFSEETCYVWNAKVYFYGGSPDAAEKYSKSMMKEFDKKDMVLANEIIDKTGKLRSATEIANERKAYYDAHPELKEKTNNNDGTDIDAAVNDDLPF